MIRVLSYNILLGGTRRLDQLCAIMRASGADVIGLVEATNPFVVEELARRLDMHWFLSGRARHNRDWQIAVLSRLPILHTRVHTHPDLFTRRHVLEVQIEAPGGEPLTIFIAHLTSNFFRGRMSNQQRRREVQMLLHLAEPYREAAHLLMGDFNSLAPGEDFRGSALMRYLRYRAPHYKPGNSRAFFKHLLKKMLHISINNELLAPLIDGLSRVYAQGGIDLLYKAGYVDCYRYLHPDARGYTYHSAMPAARIDYIFASPQMASRLITCDIITYGDGVESTEASDHLPVCAAFACPP
ncbi:MAG: endonuclease/exonuclease/phosphatase family protein [Ktedonobacteraceae bacterium]|nr:endonuclease/exonuclease/phosphatase family protein [Ktedonobacteraceae bacterium]